MLEGAADDFVCRPLCMPTLLRSMADKGLNVVFMADKDPNGGQGSRPTG